MLNNNLSKSNNNQKQVFSRVGIRKLLIIFLTLFGFLVIGAFTLFTYKTTYNVLYKERIERLKYVTDFVVKVFEYQNSLVLNHQKTLKQAQKEAISIIKAIPLKNKGYIWIDKSNGSSLYHPYSQYSRNNELKTKIIERSKEKGGGYLQYKWIKPSEKTQKYYDQVAYIKTFKDWDWIIGTGVYVDDINKMVSKALFKGIAIVLASFLLLALILRYIIHATVVIPIEKLANISLQLAENNITVTLPEIEYNTEIGKLYRAYNKFVEVYKEKRDNEEKLSRILESINDVLITADVYGTIKSANPAVDKMFGVTPDEIIGKNVDLLTSPSLFSGNPEDFEGIKYVNEKYELLGVKNERYFPIEIDVNEILSGDEKLFILLIRNITNQKEIEKMKNEFVYVMGHELKTPLMEIRASAEYLLNEFMANTDSKMKHLISRALEDVSGLIDLINDILDIEKIEADKIDFKYEITNVFNLIEETISANKALADKFDVNIKFINNMPKNTLINVDKGSFAKVLINLISNAAKFSAKNDEIVILSNIKYYSVQISVKDNGPGIPPELENRIFEKFIRASKLGEKQKSGAGLGLSICKGLVEKMDGQISFETEVGQGTTFHVEFPLYVGEVE